LFPGRLVGGLSGAADRAGATKHSDAVAGQKRRRAGAEETKAMSDFTRTTMPRRSLLKAAGAGLAASAAALPRRAQADEPVHLTYWTWVPNRRPDLDLFEATHPGIKVDLVNAGQGNAHYTKLRTAIQAGTGAPDIAIVEFQMLRSMNQIGALLDLAPYGAGALKDDFVDWTWQQVDLGGKIVGMPSDSGPIAILYRKDIFDAHAIEPPVTWDDFAEAALKLHQDAPDVFLTDMQLNNGSWFQALASQAGSRPFALDGTTVTIRVNDEPARQVAAYWQKLINAKAVDAAPGNTAEWYQSYDQGRYACWITASWGPLFLSQFARNSAGKWRVSPIPQWTRDAHASANYGGSTMAVTTQTRHPREAAELAMFMTHDPKLVQQRVDRYFAFPTIKSVLESAAFQDRPFPFYGDQAINRIFVESSHEVDGSYQYSPFQDYVHSQLGIEMSAAASGHGTLVESLDRVQRNLVTFAKAQGFTVKT
jgi:multiple sugar transport system substrate-binding protein